MQTKVIPDFFLFRWRFFRKSNKKAYPPHGWRISFEGSFCSILTYSQIAFRS